MFLISTIWVRINIHVFDNPSTTEEIHPITTNIKLQPRIFQIYDAHLLHALFKNVPIWLQDEKQPEASKWYLKHFPLYPVHQDRKKTDSAGWRYSLLFLLIAYVKQSDVCETLLAEKLIGVHSRNGLRSRTLTEVPEELVYLKQAHKGD